MTTASELTKLIGRIGTVDFNGIEFDIKIVDAKIAYGNQRVNIVPLSGNGSRWVDLTSIKLT